MTKKLFFPTALLLSACAFFGLAVTPLSAAVITAGDTLNGEFFEDWTDEPETLTTSGSISAGSAANSILLVAVGSTLDQEADPSTPLSVSYGGQDLTRAVTSGEDNFRISSIWYLTNPASHAASSQISITTGSASNTGNNEMFASAAVFSGVDLNDPFLATAEDFDNSDKDGVELSYDLGASPVDTVYFESIFYNSGFADGSLIDNKLYTAGEQGSTGNFSMLQGYTFANGVSGTVLRDFGETSGNNQSGAGVALAAIPEPSAWMLLLVGGSAFLLRRRRVC